MNFESVLQRLSPPYCSQPFAESWSPKAIWRLAAGISHGNLALGFFSPATKTMVRSEGSVEKPRFAIQHVGALNTQTRLLASLNHMREHLVSPSIISFNTGGMGFS